MKRKSEADIKGVTVNSGLHRDADEICDILGYNATSSGNPLRTFRENISVPSSRVKKSKKTSRYLKMGPIHCPETLVKDYHSTLKGPEIQGLPDP
jgi:hypothetical protein